MAKMNIPASPTLYYTYYDKLKGADFTSDPTQVDKRRSPEVLNMIKENGNIVKRKGWHFVTSWTGEVLKMFRYNEKTYVVTKKRFYENNVVKYSGNIDNCAVTMLNDSVSVMIGGKYFFMFKSKDEISGKYETVTVDMMRKDGPHYLADFCAEPYIPDVVISRNPDGSGGTFLESVNLLTTKRRVSFLSDGTSKNYHLYPPVDENSDMNYMNICIDNIKVEKMSSLGYFYELTKGIDYTCQDEQSVRGFDIYGNAKDFLIAKPVIVFSEAPEKSPVTGQDNVRITFESFNSTQSTIYQGQDNPTLQKLLKCSMSIPYGRTADDRIFCVTGENMLYYSDINRPNYFPDDNYIIIGNEGKIVGLTKMNTYLVVIKEKSESENTVFLVKGDTHDGKTVFVSESTMGNTGALGKTFCTLNDEPLFLSRNGICAISNSYISSEKMIKNRSFYIDGKMLKESELGNAIATTWRNYYVLCVNSHVYLLDSKQTTSLNGDYVYEGYYWDNIPATYICEIDGELYYSTKDGWVYKYSDDIEGESAYMDNAMPIYDGAEIIGYAGGKAINSHWATPLDDDAKPQYFKNLNKKGTALTLLPYNKSSVSVFFSKDGNVKSFIGKTFVDIFDWNVIDFSRFSFNSNEAVQDAYANKKIKKYKRLQFIFENNEPGEPFGLVGFVKTYTVGNFAK